MKAETVSRRRRAVTTALIILSAAVLLFAAESLYSNRDLIMFDKDKYPDFTVSADDYVISKAAEADGDSVKLGSDTSIEIATGGHSIKNISFDVNSAVPAVCSVKVLTKTDAHREKYVQDTRYEYLSDGARITVTITGEQHVYYIKLVFDSACSGDTISGITFNSPPAGFAFNSVRWFLLSAAAAFVVFVLRNKYHLKVYNPSSSTQKQLIAVLVLLLLVPILHVFLLQEKVTGDDGSTEREGALIEYPLEKAVDDYGCYVQLFDAFKKGQLNLDVEFDLSVLETLENPYDKSQRDELGFGNGIFWDRSYYNGKLYCYFGAAPVIFVYFPIYFLTGSIPSDITAAAVLAAAAIIFEVLLLLQLFNRFGRGAPFLLVLLCTAALPAATLVYSMFAAANFYYIALLAGVGACCAFLYFSFCALSAGDGVKRKLMFALAGCSLAAVAASRPNLIIYLIIVLPLMISVLVKRPYGTKSAILDAAAFALPAIAAGTLIMVYNYARFGSPFDFGSQYQLTLNDVSSYALDFGRLFPAIYHYLLQLPDIDTVFPYLHPSHVDMKDYGGYIYNSYTVGALSFPVTAGSALAYRRNGHLERAEKYTLRLVIPSAVLVAFVDICLAGIHIRYSADVIFVLFLFGAPLICAFVGERIKSSSYSFSYAVALLLVLISLAAGAAAVFDNENDYILKNFPLLYDSVRKLFI